MFTSVIILLKESLEAAIIISLLLATQKKLFFSKINISAVLLISIFSIILLSYFFEEISNQLEGSGQEIMNGFLLISASLSLTVYLLFANHVLKNFSSFFKKTGIYQLTGLIASFVIISSIVREGAEIAVYLRGVIFNPNNNTSSIIMGSIMGSGLGICIGILIFFLLSGFSRAQFIVISTPLLMLISSGLMMEAVKNLIQANLIFSDIPIWDTSAILSERSITGQLLYAIFAYEATPTLSEVMSWAINMITLMIGLLWIHFKKPFS